jgi:hypothetical protein
MAAKKTSKRPPANREKSAVFSTRMDPSLRRQVEASAEKNSDGNLSREIDRLLKEALALHNEKDKNLRAVFYLVSQMARMMPGWRTDPFIFQAFQVGVFAVLGRLAPEGDPVPPENIIRAMTDKGATPEEPSNLAPQDYGFFISRVIWAMLENMERPPEGVSAPFGSWPWAFPQVREVLKVKPAGQRHREALIAALLKGEPK